MRIKIPRRQVFKFNGVLQLDIQFLDYPDQPWVNIRIPLPTTEKDIKLAIEANIVEVKRLIADHEEVRDQFKDLIDVTLDLGS